MKCYSHPRRIRNPYTDAPVAVRALTCESDLILMCPKDRLFLRGDGTLIRPGRRCLPVGARDHVTWQCGQEQRRHLTAPAGVVTGLTSVPGLLRPLTDRAGPWLEAGILHDWLYVAWLDHPG